MKSKRTAIVAVIVLVFGGWFTLHVLRKRWSYASDERNSPWAYSDNPQTKLLVGKWSGAFTDPVGVEKKIEVEILPPMTEEERQKKANRRVKHRKGLGSSKDHRAFDGTATVTSKLGTESYTIFGHVGKSDYHTLDFQFAAEDESKRILPNYAVRAAGSGQWQDDDLNVSLSFNNLTAEGHSTSTSSGEVVNGKVEWIESPEDKPVPVSLKRISP